MHIGVVTKYTCPAMVIRREESQVSQDLQRGEAERVKRTTKGMCVTCGLCYYYWASPPSRTSGANFICIYIKYEGFYCSCLMPN